MNRSALKLLKGCLKLGEVRAVSGPGRLVADESGLRKPGPVRRMGRVIQRTIGFGLRREEAVDLCKDSLAGACLVDGFAQFSAAGDAVGKPGGELLHFAGSFADSVAVGLGLSLIEEHGEIGPDHPVPVFAGGRFIAARGCVLRNLAE